MKSTAERNIITGRSIFLGAVFSLLVAVLVPYFNSTSVPTCVSTQFIPGLALFLFFLLVFIFNSLAKLITPGLHFSPAELLVIYSMMLVTSAIPSWPLVQNLISVISGVYYYASPENEWATLIHPHLKTFFFPQGEEAIRQFYEGLPKGTSIPWLVWLKPLAFWSLFFIVVHFVMVCMMVIMRKQWVEKERLPYPLVILPMEMVKEEGEGIIPSFFKNRGMWFGFAIPFFIGSISALSQVSPAFPILWMGTYIPMFRGTTDLCLNVNFITIGVSYFLNLDVAFSLWFFHLLSRVQTGVFNITGFTLNGPSTPFFGNSDTVGYQAFGAFIVMVFFILFMARVHLKEVFAKAFGRKKEVDDSEEILSYRTAVWGMFLGLGVIFLWFCLLGIPPLVVLLFILLTFIIFIGLTRIIVQGGTGFCRPVGEPIGFLCHTVGSEKIGASGLVNLSTSYAWVPDTKALVMTSVAQGLKMTEEIKKRKRFLFWAMMLATVIGFWGASFSALYLGYHHGALNSTNPWLYKGASRLPWELSRDRILNPTHFSLQRMEFFLLGGGIMGALMFLRYRFLWWPIHYLGFPIADSEPMRYAWFGIFLTWVIKSLVLRYGGATLFQRLKPFFLGLVLGQIVVALTWAVIFSFTSYTSPVSIL